MGKEDTEEQKPNKPALPRKWNKKLLPECEVTAIDQSDPKYPGNIVLDHDELPQYPDSERLLSDPHHVRSLRLDLEENVQGYASCIADRLKAEGKDPSEFIVPFDEWLQKTIDLKLMDLREKGQESDIGLKKLLAIQADYLSEPMAGKIRRN